MYRGEGDERGMSGGIEGVQKAEEVTVRGVVSDEMEG